MEAETNPTTPTNPKKRYTITASLFTEVEVQIEVEREEGQDPTDLTQEEEDLLIEAAEDECLNWDINGCLHAEETKPVSP